MPGLRLAGRGGVGNVLGTEWEEEVVAATGRRVRWYAVGAAHPKTAARTVSRSTARTLVISVAPWRSKNSTGCMSSTRKTSMRTAVRTPSAALTPLDT